MPLSYPGAELYVEKIHNDLEGIYPALPPCLIVKDEYSGDFGIAHFYGLTDSDPTDQILFRDTGNFSFDEGRTPTQYTVTHEMGHALSAAISEYRGGNGFDNGLYDEFWAARGFPGTPWEWQLKAIELTKTDMAAGYRLWPEESFADTFGVVNSPYGWPITEQHGTWIVGDQAKQDALIAFYKGLKGPDYMDIDASVNAALARFGLDANTFNFIKTRLAKDAHHKHGVTTSNGQVTDMGTTEPREV